MVPHLWCCLDATASDSHAAPVLCFGSGIQTRSDILYQDKSLESRDQHSTQSVVCKTPVREELTGKGNFREGGTCFAPFRHGR